MYTQDYSDPSYFLLHRGIDLIPSYETLSYESASLKVFFFTFGSHFLLQENYFFSLSNIAIFGPYLYRGG